MASLTWAVLLLAGFTYAQAIGTLTPIENLRGIAQLEFRLVSTWRQQCVCSIVTNYHCLTSASCLQTSSNNRRIRVGSAVKAFGGVVREVAIIVNHPDYSSDSDNADIGIVRAASSWNLGGPEINNVVLVPENYFLPPSIPLTIGGWGFTAQGGVIPNQYLYTAVLENKAMQGCIEQYPGRITPSMVCVGLTGRPGRDFDPSDTGAPVLYEGYLYGVASFGSTASGDQNAIVAQAIASYGTWVRDTARDY